jgi:hypothetical protein
VWSGVGRFERFLRDRGETTHLRICADAAEFLAHEPPPYAHVVVDEAQDLHPAQWRVLRAAVPPGPDDLFITGDPHQRIYDSRVSLGSIGIGTAGRSFRLRVNYRSTEEILTWSARLLAPVAVDALDGDGTDSLPGYRSLLHGRRPQAQGYAEPLTMARSTSCAPSPGAGVRDPPGGDRVFGEPDPHAALRGCRTA